MDHKTSDLLIAIIMAIPPRHLAAIEAARAQSVEAALTKDREAQLAAYHALINECKAAIASTDTDGRKLIESAIDRARD